MNHVKQYCSAIEEKMTRTAYVLVPTGVSNSLLGALFVVFILCSPFFSLASEWTNLPLYKMLMASFFLLVLLRWDILTGVLSAFVFSPIQWIFFFFIVLLFLKSGHDDIQKLIGALVLPWVCGMVITQKTRGSLFSSEIRLFGILLFIQCVVLSFFIPQMFLAYPRRPEFHGIAIYLLLGNFLPIMPILVMCLGERLINRSLIWRPLAVGVVVVLLLYLALLIAGINGRMLMLMSVLSVFLYATYGTRDRSFRIIGYILFPCALLLMILLLPGRAEHLLNLMLGLASYTGLGSSGLSPTLDASMLVRTQSIDSLLKDSCGALVGCTLNAQSNEFMAAHFWFPQLYYALGVPGLVAFTALFIAAVKSAIRMLSAPKEMAASEFYVGLVAMMCLASPFYSSSFMNTAPFYAMAGLLVSLRSRNHPPLML